MTILIFDGTWAGMLCCVYEIYWKKIKEVSLVKEIHFQPDAFSISVSVHTNELLARRVWAGLAKLISKKGLSSLYSCYLSELPQIENEICAFMRMAFDMKASPEHAYANAAVLRISQVDRMVHREKHRMEAFVRFQLTRDNLYYAMVEPDYNVLPLIAKHFKQRFADQRWLIFDKKRSYGIYYDLAAISEVAITSLGTDSVSNEIFPESEFLYQKLWGEYFTHVNIIERKNTKLHLMHVPKRYWKYLTEKTSGV